MKKINMKNKKSFFVFMVLGLVFLNAAANVDESDEAAGIYAQEVREANGGVTALKHSKKAKKVASQKYAGWYMRTKVSATAPDGTVYRHDTAGVFGQLKQSKNKLDKHDIPGYGAALLQVVFPHYDWADKSGDYFTDYKKWRKSNVDKRAVWTFLVRNQKTVDLSHAPITIELDGAQNVDFVKKEGRVTYVETNVDTSKRDDLTLVDVDNRKTYSYDELATANLNMDGLHKRTFRWVKGKVHKKDFKLLPELK